MLALYVNYGDRTVLTDHYEFLTRYMDLHGGPLDDGIIRVDQYGDHAPPAGSNPEEDKRLVGTAYFYKSAREMAQIATVLGRAADAQRYDALADQVRDRFNAVYYDPARGYYDTFDGFEYKQTSNAVPLGLGLVPEAHEASVVQSLVADIEARGGHLNTGILGTSVLLPVLTEHGHHDVAHQLASRTSYPSWGHWIVNGTTTIPSRWPIRPGSNNHYMLGTIDEWFYRHVTGIVPDPSGPGYQRFVVRPHPGGVNEAKAKYRSIRGEIEVEWEHRGDPSSSRSPFLSTRPQPSTSPSRIRGASPKAASGPTVPAASASSGRGTDMRSTRSARASTASARTSRCSPRPSVDWRTRCLP